MSENIGKCKDCKWFGQYLINDEDLDIDWCFNPNKEGAVATLWSCEDWEEKDHFHSGEPYCNTEEYLKADAIIETIKEKLQKIILDCVEHHGYQDDDEATICLTIQEVKQLLELLSQRLS